jgi:hypothetical protein
VLFAAYEETHLLDWIPALALGPAVVFLLGHTTSFDFSASTWFILDVVAIACYATLAVMLLFPKRFQSIA